MEMFGSLLTFLFVVCEASIRNHGLACLTKWLFVNRKVDKEFFFLTKTLVTTVANNTPVLRTWHDHGFIEVAPGNQINISLKVDTCQEINRFLRGDETRISLTEAWIPGEVDNFMFYFPIFSDVGNKEILFLPSYEVSSGPVARSLAMAALVSSLPW